MKLTRISNLQGCGVFRSFFWPEELPDFKQYNLIYGWNGTGKTTLSRLLRDLELKRSPTLGSAVLRIDSSEVRSNSFSHSDVQVRVFNRDFIQENIFPVEEHDMPPILILGAENANKQREIETLKERLSVARGKLKLAEDAEKTAKKEFNNFCINCARVVKDTLRVNSRNRYNNYDKSNFKTDAMEMVDAGDNTIHQLEEAEREKLLLKCQANPMQKVPLLDYVFPNLNVIIESLSELLTTTVVSEVIEALRTDVELANWTRQGLALHRYRNSELCQFCEQPLPKNRIATLEKHFSDQYENFMQRIIQEINKLNDIFQVMTNLRLPDKARLYPNLALEYETQETNLKNILHSMQDFIGTVLQILENKKSKAFEQISLELQAPEVNADAVEKLNVVIGKHNQACNDFESHAEDARKRLAKGIIAAYLEEFICYKNNEQCAIKNKKRKCQEVDCLITKIEDLETEIVEHRQPAEELNKDLQNYLGHNELCLEVRKTGYAMTRSGMPAKFLSEGETTAIALLYFLKSLKDKRFPIESGAIVLDDPVSSLDANALFLAFGFIRERTFGACQIFILTHNFSLFQQVRNWFHHLKGQRKPREEKRPAQFYMLESVLENGIKNSIIRRLDPLLENYDSEYHYLFARVYKVSNERASNDLEKSYILPNMARRMLEVFLAFRVPQITGKLWEQLGKINFDESKKLRICRFLHTHSHSAAVGQPEHDLSALNEGPSVLKDLMDMIKSEDPRHFSAMRDLVTQSTESDTAS